MVAGQPATGISFSIERMMAVTKMQIEIEKYLIVSLGEDKKAIDLAKKLRIQGKNVSVFYGKPSKALEYANSYKIKKVIFVGEKEVKEKLIVTKGDAAAILEEAKKLSENAKQANLVKTKEEVAKLIEKAKEQIASEKDGMITEIKSEVSAMVVTALEKILSTGISKDLDKKYIDKVLKDLK